MTILIDTGLVPEELRGDDLLISLHFPDARAFHEEADDLPCAPFSARLDIHGHSDLNVCVFSIHSFGCPEHILHLDSADDYLSPLVSEETLARMLKPVSDAFKIDLSFTRIQDCDNHFLYNQAADVFRIPGDVGIIAFFSGIFDLDPSPLRALSFHKVIEAHERCSLIQFLRAA